MIRIVRRDRPRRWRRYPGRRQGRRGRRAPVRSGLLVAVLVLGVADPPVAAAAPVPPIAARAGAPAPGLALDPAPLGFRSPVGGLPVVVTAFRPPSHRYGSGHRGVDLAVAAGTPIRAAGAGTVVFAGRLADRPVVSIEHDGGLRTTYEPVEPSVGRGARVAAGDVIGTVAPGHPSCPGVDCLHWGARLPDRVYLDPLLLLGSWPVRLWPWDDP